ncbi:MAG: PIN domain-containing protein [Spirochaetaceae bacterium]
MPKEFLDTSILVYANDRAAKEKQNVAISLVKGLIRSGGGVLSTQVQMEYAAVATGKLGQPREAITRQLFVLERLEVVAVSGETVRNGLELAEAFDVSFRNALVLAAAHAARCEILWSEDFQHDRLYGAVRVRNPFLA